jgi:patatin-like phospholipase/acyl hydrolase
LAPDSVLGSLTEERYPAGGIESVLQQYFGETRLKDACTDVPRAQLRDLSAGFPSSSAAPWPAKRSDYDFPMWLAARATSAAPTYFEPAKVPPAVITGP